MSNTLLGIKLCKYIICVYTTTEDVTLQAGTTIGMGGEYVLLSFLLGTVIGGLFIYWLMLRIRSNTIKRKVR